MWIKWLPCIEVSSVTIVKEATVRLMGMHCLMKQFSLKKNLTVAELVWIAPHHPLPCLETEIFLVNMKEDFFLLQGIWSNVMHSMWSRQFLNFLGSEVLDHFQLLLLKKGHHVPLKMEVEMELFCSGGSVALADKQEPVPVWILRDTGAAQSLQWEGVVKNPST